MPTQIESARKDTITKEIKEVAVSEGKPPEYIRDMIACGQMVIPNNTNRKAKLIGIGKGLRTKVNASIGTSSDIVDVHADLQKSIPAQNPAPHTLM